MDNVVSDDEHNVEDDEGFFKEQKEEDEANETDVMLVEDVEMIEVMGGEEEDRNHSEVE